MKLKEYPFKIIARLNFFLLVAVLLFSCTITRYKKLPLNKPFVAKNTIKVSDDKLTKGEKEFIEEKLYTQLDDSAQVKIKSPIFFLDIISAPPAYDTIYSSLSANNMEASLFHLGFYDAQAAYKADTSGRKVKVHYTINAGKRTLIDTIGYQLQLPELQQFAMASKPNSLLAKGLPITKSAVMGEINRLVDTFRNNGYYKFTAAELKVRGDTTIAALTTVSDDPFEQLELLAQAQALKDSPKIKLALVLNPPEDSSKLEKYFIDKIYLLIDYVPGDNLIDTVNINQRTTASGNFILRYHQQFLRIGFIARNILFKRGEVFRQNDYYQTLTNLAKAGMWQSVNIQIVEHPQSNKLDLIVELIPIKKFGFEATLETSYSAVTNQANAIGGSQFGLSGNLSFVNRNIAREAIHMTHSLHAGVEFNNNARSNTTNLINSNEFRYSNSIIIPRIINLFPSKDKNITGRRGRYKAGETFFNTSIAYANRLQLFNLQSVDLSIGTSKINKEGAKWVFRPVIAEFNYLFNESDSFRNILKDNPFLRYSYNTAFAGGMGLSWSKSFFNPRHLRSTSKERTIKWNVEESGLTWGLLPFLNKYKKKYIKTDVEYHYTVSYKKTVLAFHFFGGVGIPLSKKDTTLPFFKQYFGGGSTSLRGWPVRGVGLGSQPLKPYQKNIFNERTGDIKLEANVEYRYDIAKIIPNTLILRGAVFADAGNIWNWRPSVNNGITSDTGQFKLKNLYREIGLSAGTGLRLDFNYVVLRLDFGFRVKRPETSYFNDGWKLPSLSFNDIIPKLFSGKYRQWRYENFNFSIGINYAF
ncbi:MAG: BamA/TamA family outer membrane protein [Chitinophagaceae bacterium]|nr:BamA/TamA family outer membrane protein [Chitinophagaceae bacterium]